MFHTFFFHCKTESIQSTCDLSNNCLRDSSVIEKSFYLFFHKVTVPPTVQTKTSITLTKSQNITFNFH